MGDRLLTQFLRLWQSVCLANLWSCKHLDTLKACFFRVVLLLLFSFRLHNQSLIFVKLLLSYLWTCLHRITEVERVDSIQRLDATLPICFVCQIDTSWSWRQLAFSTFFPEARAKLQLCVTAAVGHVSRSALGRANRFRSPMERGWAEGGFVAFAKSPTVNTCLIVIFLALIDFCICFLVASLLWLDLLLVGTSILAKLLDPLYLLHIPFAKHLGTFDQVITYFGGFFTVNECVLVVALLRLKCTYLQIHFALVPRFMHLLCQYMFHRKSTFVC